MNVVTAAQTREIDRLTIEGGVAGIALMENAAHRVAETMEQEFDPIAKHNIVVLCGKGNNGGDGLVVARKLKDSGCTAVVFLFANPGSVEGDAAANLKSSSGDPGLDSVLSEIELRVEVELAKAGHF